MYWKTFSQPWKKRLVNTHMLVSRLIPGERVKSFCNENTLEHNLTPLWVTAGRQLVTLTWQHISHSFLLKHTAATAFRHRSLKSGSGNRHCVEVALSNSAGRTVVCCEIPACFCCVSSQHQMLLRDGGSVFSGTGMRYYILKKKKKSQQKTHQNTPSTVL